MRAVRGRLRRCIGLLLLALPSVASAQALPDASAAGAVFKRMQQLCAADDGKAWGVSLCGPVLLVDPASRQFVASIDGADTALERDGPVFRGRLPDNVPVANTAVGWNGRTWTMLMLPLPEDPAARSILLMHEAWHRIQAGIGLAATHADQDQLETEQGRTALRLELRALAAALEATSAEQQRQAIADAMTFRAWRHARFPQAAAAEDAMERHEGIAEYTGRILAQDDALQARLAAHLRRGDAVTAYARSFAYYTGPAYGVLLDGAAPGWRSRWNRQDGLPGLLAAALGMQADAGDAAFRRAGARHGLAEVAAAEQARAAPGRRGGCPARAPGRRPGAGRAGQRCQFQFRSEPGDAVATAGRGVWRDPRRGRLGRAGGARRWAVVHRLEAAVGGPRRGAADGGWLGRRGLGADAGAGLGAAARRAPRRLDAPQAGVSPAATT